jgi:ABC-type multidrug transport system ATPase subunit
MSFKSGREHVSMGLEWRGVNFAVPDGDKDSGGMKHILKDMNGFAEPGELLAIMGPSGAGKTSLLNALARLNPMATGEILLNGKPWEESFDKLTAYMHQDESFMPDLVNRKM